MKVLAVDTETSLIRPALYAPPLVCVTYQRPGEAAQIVHVSDVEPLLRGWLENPNLVLVGHNVAYDMGVVGAAFPALLPAIFAAYDQDRVTDTMIRQQLLDIAAGVFRGSVSAKGKRIEHKYDLESLAKRCAGIRLTKGAWRLSYAEFIDVPLAQWPARAREVQARAAASVADIQTKLGSLLAWKKKDQPPDVIKALEKELEGLRSMVEGDPEQCVTYPLDDARATLAVFQAQEKHAASYLADQYRQARAAFALSLSSTWGLRTDAEGVALLRKATQEELDEIEEGLKMLGLVRADGSRDTKAAKARMVKVCQREGLVPIFTDAHFKNGTGGECPDGNACAEHICLDADACERTGDDFLIDYAKRTTLAKQLSNDIPALEKGTEYPVHTRYGMAASGRTTSSRPNIQNQSKRPGFRECFVPRSGKIFAQCDYPTLELYTLAQCCKIWFGFSKLAEALKSEMDPHSWVASIVLKQPYEEVHARYKAGEPVATKARAQAKPANFGFPGGMGIAKFLTSTRKAMGREEFNKLDLDEPRVQKLKEDWLAAFPEMRCHFSRAAALTKGGGLGQVETLFTRRHRGGTTYCATANNGFQALGADIAKRAMWLVARAEYDVTQRSILYGSRTVAFVHDEIIIEIDEAEQAHDKAHELARLMSVAANEYLSDVQMPVEKLEPLLMHRWSKNAKTTFDATGRLVPWHEINL